jgi:hypothetical protein
MAFVLIPFTQSIAVGASYSFICLFTIWIFTPNLVKIKTQMVFTFAFAVLLLVAQTDLVASSETLGIVLGTTTAFAIVGSLLLHLFQGSLRARFGDSAFDAGSTSSSKKKQTESQRVPDHKSRSLMPVSFRTSKGIKESAVTQASSPSIVETKAMETQLISTFEDDKDNGPRSQV